MARDQSSTDQMRTDRRWLALAILCAGTLMTILDSSGC
jgi:hypothetical protein